jgi:hypothetical protein
MWLPLSLTTHDNAHDKKTNPAHFSNSAPQSPVPFRVVRPPFHYPVNDHTGGFETLPYIGRSPSVFAGNDQRQKNQAPAFFKFRTAITCSVSSCPSAVSLSRK